MEATAEINVVESVPLAAIALSKTNEMFRRPHELTPQALDELVNSIKQYGVIQPILVRPDPENSGRYILISGERRYRASQLAGKETIAAQIKKVTDEVALILQITENVLREDVHALNEAKGYKVIIESDPATTIRDLATRFAKSQTYVLQRLKLNDLVKEAKKSFYTNKMSLGHALILARLTPADQRNILTERSKYKNGLGTPNDLQEYVDQHIVNTLSAAPFDKNDSELVKKAGACINCPKRSGASPLLFSEIKEKDKCFDRSCFLQKCRRFTINQVKEIIETQPETALLQGYHEPSDEIMQLLDEHKVKALREYDDFNTHGSGKKIKGLWISGAKAGQLVMVFVKKESEEQKRLSESPKALVAKIQQRLERSVELDQDKVYAKILAQLAKHPTQKKGGESKLQHDEELFLWFMVLDKAGIQLKRELYKYIGITKETPEKIYEALRKLKAEQRAFMLRRVMLDQYGGNYPRSTFGYIIYKIALGYQDIDIKTFEKEQGEIRTKREIRAKQRIKEAQVKMKPKHQGA